jgi:hypothetical protein
MGKDDDVTPVEIVLEIVNERDAAYDTVRDLVKATAGHVGCRVCKAVMSRHAETIVKAKRATRG